MNKATQKYLTTYAESEARFAARLIDEYGVCLTIPVLGESKNLFVGLAPALSSLSERALVIVVVNAREHSTDAQKQANALLIEHMLGLGSTLPIAAEPRITLVRAEIADLLVIDRSSPGAWFPQKQGVGLARRIGCDFGLALHAHGKLRSPWLFTSDGDVTLPIDYFAVATQANAGVSALLYPFWHEATGEGVVDEATADYETWLRYYVLGLTAAGSPYAYHSLGSSIAIRVDAYASVRGFPRRDAAEDFYLLDKLAKVAPLQRLKAAEIRIAARTSKRVPFGTGARVASLVESGSRIDFYDPRVFEALRHLLRALGTAVNAADPSSFARELQQVPEDLAAAVNAAAHELRAHDALISSRESNDPRARLRRVHTWFDAFRTLKFIHLLERHELPRISWQEAVARAPFLARLTGEAREVAAAARRPLSALEAALPGLIGPTLVTPVDRDPSHVD
jgi:hypothetical protein